MRLACDIQKADLTLEAGFIEGSVILWRVTLYQAEKEEEKMKKVNLMIWL